MKQVYHAILLAILGLSAVAQESAPQRIVVPLIANSSQHVPTSITIESIVIRDQKSPVSGASLLRGAEFPLELGILIDASSSQRNGRLDDVLKSTKQFVNDMIRGPEDRVFFLTFDATPHATGWLKKEQLQAATIKVDIGGGTAVYDAIGMASKQRMGARDPLKTTRRVLVLISDGDDNQSHITRDEAASEALRAGTVIFTINTGREVDFGEKVMEKLAMLTGGESFSRLGKNDAPRVFDSIRELINGLYYLTYVPPDASKRAVHEVEVKPASNEKFELSYARKYFWNP